MSRRSTHRLITVLLVALSLLFGQLAMASYVCPAEADPSAMAEAMASGQSCDQMDAQQPALCHQHAVDPGKTFEVAKVPVPSLPALILVLELAPAGESVAVQSVLDARPLDERPPPAPPFLSTLRLRV
ncbi:MAG: hypothetical protein JOY60_01015 [Burkholderiaceae bacterium]|nr:hypothetical protein [Burkholderiaceae bacterium]